MRDTSNIFKALPHVNEIWVTEDGHFHLHPANGGTKITRGEVEEEAKPVPQKKAKEVIELIENATSAEEVQEILGDDDRATVKAAADKKIASF